MNRFKATALILSIAVFNPLCCCLQLFAAAQAAPQEDAAHACCSENTAPGNQSQNASSDHASDTCPHSYEKESLIAHSIDSPDLQAKLTGYLSDFSEITPQLLETRHPSANSLAPRSQPLPPAIPVSEAYCVLLL